MEKSEFEKRIELEDDKEQYAKDCEAILRKEISDKITEEDVKRYQDLPTLKEALEFVKENPGEAPMMYMQETKQDIIDSIFERKFTLGTENTRVKIEINSKEDLDNLDLDSVKTSGAGGKPIVIEPKVYFEHIKNSLSTIELEKLKERFQHFSRLFSLVSRSGQHALRENISDRLIELTKEQEVAAIGLSKYVEEKTIEKFIRHVKGRVAYFKPLKDFPRVLPANVLEKVEEMQGKKVFTELWVLYLDYTKESDNVKSTSTKIIEKDPILFGKTWPTSDKFYYIVDWEDEFCNLTLDKFVSQIQELDPKWKIPEIEDIKPIDIAALIEEREDQMQRLKDTNSYNYRSLSAEEEERYTKQSSKRWYQFWK